MTEENPFFREDLLLSILAYCDEGTRANCISLTKTISKILTTEISFKWRVHCLHVERGVYHSPDLPPKYTWRSIFLKNRKMRNLWYSSKGNENGQKQKDSRYQLTVSARFKPKGQESPHNLPGKVALPLHQRMALIRANRKTTSRKEAFKVLVHQGGWFGDAMEKCHNNDDDSMAMIVPNASISQPAPTVTGGVHLVDPHNNCAILVDKTKGLRKFDFDYVFDERESQEQVYNKTTMPLIAEFINGYNATCLVYGQTGSGKTHSMFGANNDENGFSNFGTSIPDSWGIIPRACVEVFRALKYRRESLSIKIQSDISVSYVEVYGNEVNDLLDMSRACGQNRVSAQRYVLDGSSEVRVSSLGEILSLLDKGEKQKRKAATAMNARSSRAHALFIMTLRQENVHTGVKAESRIFLVDLGGSEQIKKSQPFRLVGEKSLESEKERVKEAVNINLGLLSLKQCVEALRKRRHVPYGDSKLTMLLSAGLGGDSKTSVVVCGAQEEVHGPETIASMKFGLACKGVYNTVTSNVKMLQSLLHNLDKRIERCERKIRENERWEERGDEIRDDDGNFVEVRKKTVVVGADEYRLELSALIQQKAELTGEDIGLQMNDSNAIATFGDFYQYNGLRS